ncbi:ABC transporter permease [archaeon]|nr:MAG: ABC transporter permease [archaeon]
MDVWELQQLTQRTVEHLTMFAIALVVASIVGIIVGVIVYRRFRVATVLFNVLNIAETIPTLALLVLLLPLLGLGMKPTIVTSIIYSILPIARNTYTGLTSVDKEHILVAEALGLSDSEILRKVRFPLALPLIAGGIRIALVFTMGVVTLGGLIAAGGLGAPLQTGIQLYDKDIIIVTGLWVGLLALILDSVAGMIEHRLEVNRDGTR